MFYPRLQECLQDVLVDMEPMILMMTIGDPLLPEETKGKNAKWNG